MNKCSCGVEISPPYLVFPIADEAIFYSPLSQRLIALERNAVVLLLRLADGATVNELTAELELDPAAVAVATELAAILAGDEPPAEEPEPDNLPPRRQLPAAALTGPFYRLLDTVFTLDCPEAALDGQLRRAVAHLGCPEAAEVTLQIEARPAGEGWQLLFNGMPQGGELPAARLLPLLAGRLRGLVYRCRPYLLSMHAAALNWRGRTLLLSGPSGSGKSTLAATLLARGGELLSDEPVVLDEQGAVLPLPVPLMLKEASWPLLAAAIPGLMSQPQVLRFDGTPLRYLDAALIPFAAAPAPGIPLLLFPRYTPGAPPRLPPAHPGHRPPPPHRRRLQRPGPRPPPRRKNPQLDHRPPGLRTHLRHHRPGPGHARHPPRHPRTGITSPHLRTDDCRHSSMRPRPLRQ